jgi:hypothetical protein
VRIHADHDAALLAVHVALPSARLIAISGVRRAPLLPAEHSLLEPLPLRRCPGQRTPKESHTTHVDSRDPSDHPGHLNRTSAKARSEVNETSSRDPSAPTDGQLSLNVTDNPAWLDFLPTGWFWTRWRTDLGI